MEKFVTENNESGYLMSLFSKAAKHACGYAYFDVEYFIKQDMHSHPFISQGVAGKTPYRTRHYAAKKRVHNQLQEVPASTFVSAFFGQPPRSTAEAKCGVTFTTYLKRFAGWPGKNGSIWQKVFMPIAFLWHLITLPLRITYNTIVLFTEFLPHTLSKACILKYRQLMEKYPQQIKKHPKQKNIYRLYRPLITLSAIFNLFYCGGRAITSPFETVRRLWNDDAKEGAIISGIFSFVIYAVFSPLLLLAGGVGSLMQRLENSIDRDIYRENRFKKMTQQPVTPTTSTQAGLIQRMPKGKAQAVERKAKETDKASQKPAQKPSSLPRSGIATVPAIYSPASVAKYSH